MSLYDLVLTLHLLAAITWVGGMLFLGLVAVPAFRGLEPPLRARLLTSIGRQFRWVGWASIAVLLSTGLIILSYYGVGPRDLLDTSFWGTRFGARLAFKLALIGVMLLLSALHDFVLGPRSTALSQSGADPRRAVAFRRQVSWLARLSLVLAILVVWTSVGLTR
ncbi:MAG: DUF4149 domain-containing protein [Chloroflexi bacterium]|nr:DUF4149 domain-containing protein [Chloroflexota bacterium]